MRGLFILFLFQALGEAGNRWLHIPLPGAVLGMLLLFFGLCIARHTPDSLETTSKNLIASLGMLLIPAATGFGYYLVHIKDQILPLAAAIVIGTTLAIIFTAFVMSRLLAEEKASEVNTHD